MPIRDSLASLARISRLLVLSYSALLWCQGPGTRPTGGPLYLLFDESRSEWCGYRDIAEWTRHSRIAVSTILVIIRSPDAPGEIGVQQRTPTGDWIVDDRYTIDRASNLTGLTRMLVYFSEDARKESVYRIAGGRAALVSSAATSLATGARLALPPAIDQYDDWPVITDIKKFPFSFFLSTWTKHNTVSGYCRRDS